MRTDAILSGRTLLILGVGIALVSCRMSGEVIAEHESTSGGRIYKNVLILARSADPAFRAEAEDAFRDILDDTRTGSAGSLGIFTPGRAYAEAEIRRTLSERAIDGVILFRALPVRDPGSHAGGYAQIVDAINYGAAPAGKEEAGGEYEVSLIDAGTGRTIWLSPASISGSGPRSSREIVHPVAVRSVRQLQDAGILPPPKKAKWYKPVRR